MAIVRLPLSGEDIKSTANNTEVPIFGITIDANTSGFLNYNVVCQRLSDKATKSWSIGAGFKKVGSAAPVIVSELLGSILGTTGDKLDLILATATFSTDADNIYFNVKGLNSNMIWYARADGYQVLDNGA